MNTQRYFIINDYIIFNENLNEHSQFNHRLGVNSKKYIQPLLRYFIYYIFIGVKFLCLLICFINSSLYLTRQLLLD